MSLWTNLPGELQIGNSFCVAQIEDSIILKAAQTSAVAAVFTYVADIYFGPILGRKVEHL
jgi:hypothetical protein